MRAGRPFDPATLDDEKARVIQDVINAAFKRLRARVATSKDNVGLFGSRDYLGEDYESRAAGAMIGIYGQNESDAIYFSYQTDAEGKRAAFVYFVSE